MKKEMRYYDSAGNRCKAEDGVRAEEITYSDDGSVIQVDYFNRDAGKSQPAPKGEK